jgi:hypothetical protein
LTNTKKKAFIFTILIVFSISLMPIANVQAAGFFEQNCSKCNGVGTIPHNATVTCLICTGLGNVTRTLTCDKCNGTKQMTISMPCATCAGSGWVNPGISFKSVNAYDVAAFFSDSIIRIEVLANNPSDKPTYIVIQSGIHVTSSFKGSGPGDYSAKSPKTLLPAHSDTLVTFDTPTPGQIFAMYTYQVYLIVADPVPCSTCQGAGALSSIVTCDKCGGVGTVNVNGTCTNCDGVGTVTTLENLPCTECNGTGQIINMINVSLLTVTVALIAVGSIGAFMLHKKKSAKLPPPP